MTKEDLQKYCGDRCTFSKPFSKGDFSYATDNHILIRVPRIWVIGEQKVGINVDSLEKYLEKHIVPRSLYCPIPDIPDLEYDYSKASGRFYRNKYLNWLKELPECILSEVKGLDPAHFIFAGGDGVLMPLDPSFFKEV